MTERKRMMKHMLLLTACALTGARLLPAFGDVTPAALPGGYTELPYVESTYNGGQWVYTDYVPEWNHRIVCKFRVNQVGTWNSPGVFCARGTATNDKGYCLSFGQGGNNRVNLPGALQCWTGGWAAPSSAPFFYPDLLTDYEVHVNVELKKWCVDDGERWNTREHTSFTAGSPLAIFCRHELGNSLSPSSTFGANNCMAGRIYYLRAYDANGTLIHEFVPARDDNAMVPTKYFGFYDTVDAKFWPNCGATAFATDPSVPSNVRVVDRADYDTDEEAGTALVATVAAAFPTDRIKVTGGTKAAPHVYRITSPLLMEMTNTRLFGDSDDAEATVIDAGGTSAGVVVKGSGISVSGLTVRNATNYVNGTTYCGGGLALIAEGSVASNMIVCGCVNGGVEKALRGGGVYLYKSTLVDALVKDCVISNDMDTTGKTAFYGGGVYAERSTVSRLEVSGCLAVNNQMCESMWWATGAFRGGGLMLNESSATDCYIHNNMITNGPKQTSSCNVSHGAGVALMGASTLSRSLVTGNSAPCSAAGVNLESASAVIDCTISSNTVFFAWSGAYPGGGLYLRNASQRAVNCLLEGNRNLGTYWDAGGGAGVIEAGVFLGGVVRGNGSYNTHGGGFFLNGACLVSNVVFDANWSTDSSDRCGSGAIEFRGGGAVVRDCWFVRNIGGDNANNSYGTVFYGSYDTGSVLQNCFFANNTGACVLGGSIETNKADCVAEACTFVKNHVSRGAVWCTALDYSVPGTVQKMAFTNCVFWKNGENEDKPGIPDKFKNVSTKVSYCYDEIGTGLTPGDYHNLTAANGEPFYADAENGEWRIGRKASVLVDNGLKLDWMGDGAKDGPLDMGDGTWSEAPAATISVRGKTMDVGVIVTRNNAQPRISPQNGLPDIGCAEYQAVNGFILRVH